MRRVVVWFGRKEGRRGTGGQSYRQIPAAAAAAEAVAPTAATLRFCNEPLGVGTLSSSSSVISGKNMACFSSGTLQMTIKIGGINEKTVYMKNKIK